MKISRSPRRRARLVGRGPRSPPGLPPLMVGSMKVQVQAKTGQTHSHVLRERSPANDAAPGSPLRPRGGGFKRESRVGSKAAEVGGDGVGAVLQAEALD